jgi:hypothetical protein
MILGTAACMSPGQAEQRAFDRRADIWAFDCLLHEMLAGRLWRRRLDRGGGRRARTRAEARDAAGAVRAQGAGLAARLLLASWPPGYDVSADGSRLVVVEPAGEKGPSGGIVVAESWAREIAK